MHAPSRLPIPAFRVATCRAAAIRVPTAAARVPAARVLAVATAVALVVGVLAAPPAPAQDGEPDVVYTFTGFGDVREGTARTAGVNAAVRSRGRLTDTTPLRFRATLTRDGTPVVGQTLEYRRQGEQAFTAVRTDGAGRFLYPPLTEQPFTLADSPLLESPAGESTEVRFTLPRGDHRMSVQLADFSDLPPEVARRSGPTRIETAAAISAATFAPDVPVVFVATAARFPDALTGGPAAALGGGPVLLVQHGDIPEATEAELRRLRPRRIVVLGGTAAVSAAVEQALADFTTGPVERRAGLTRFHTAADVAQGHFAAGVPAAFVATGRDFPDALSGGAAAALLRGPVLLVQPDGVPEPTAAALRDLRPGRIYVLGGRAAVSDATLEALRGLTDGPVERLAGPERFATSAAVAGLFDPALTSTAYVATGLDFPDALAGVPAAALASAPVLLVDRSGVPTVVADALRRLGVRRLVLLGGTAALPGVVADALAGLVVAGPPGADDAPGAGLVGDVDFTVAPTPPGGDDPGDPPPAPDAAAVALTAPTSESPAAVTEGAYLAVTFATDRAGTYEVQRKPAGAAVEAFRAFPDPTAAGAVSAGTHTVTITAPGSAERYDLRLAFTTAAGAASFARQDAALVVVGPPVLPADRCDPLDGIHCLFPFPNDLLSAAHPTNDTGRRVNLSVLSTPRNTAGKPVDPSEWNRNDGFSPGALIMTVVPGVDLAVTGAAPLVDIPRSLDPDAPIVLLNADTGERHPFWAELDEVNTDPARTPVLVRPATNLKHGTRYIVALRNLRRADGSVIAPDAPFAAFRDGTAAGARVPHMERLFADLSAAGIGRSDLYLAWDFTVASSRNYTERVLHMRDEAFADLGAAAPTFEITSVQDSPQSGVARRVEGTITLPSYLDLPGGPPGSRLNYLGSDDGTPRQLPGNTQQMPFWCNIPLATVSDPTDPAATVTPARAGLYGHGLLGSGSQVFNGYVRTFANDANFVFCATDWIGMATEDLPAIASIIADLSNFPILPDRGQQGFLNFLFLGRAMIHPDGFASHPAFSGGAGDALFYDPGDLFYYGNSQGGIMGGALMALGQDFTRGVLGVPGMNYSTLLDRSVDWDLYYMFFNATYPDRLEQELLFSVMQMLWDRAEANGYAHHMTDDPLPGTPAHEVLLHVAFADHQVTMTSAEVEARTIGASVHQPALAAGRHHDLEPYWGIPAIPYDVDGRWNGSALVVWDSGNDTPPVGNVPPRDDSKPDPHGRPRVEPTAIEQMSLFLRTDGWVQDTCAGPCEAPFP